MVFTSCGMIPVDRSVHDKTVIPAAINLLEKEAVIGIFPEGTINRTDEIIMPFKKVQLKWLFQLKVRSFLLL